MPSSAFRARRFVACVASVFLLFAPVAAQADLAPPAMDPVPAAAPAPVKTLSQAKFRPMTTTTGHRLQSVFGYVVIVGLCIAFSRNRKAIDWRLVAIGTGLQAVFAVLFLWRGTDGAGSSGAFGAVNDAIVSLLSYGEKGAEFLFASRVTGKVEGSLLNFAFAVLPSIVFFSALMAVLYHLGVMQAVIRALTWLMQRTMRTSGAETLSTAANIFVGQTEAPLLIRPFLSAMTKSELLTVMAGGMANTAGGVLAAYVGMLKDFFPEIGGHLFAESILSAPAALVAAKILWPEDGTPVTRDVQHIDIPKVDQNVIESASRGASEGLALAFNVAAMLIAFIALVSMLDAMVGGLTSFVGLGRITFQDMAGRLLVPFAWLMGTPWEDCHFVGMLLGQKIVVNEFVAYGTLSQQLAAGVAVSERAILISTYALSGFANFGSIGILIGGMGSLAPERRGDIAQLGVLAMVAGTLATFMTACFAGMLR